MWYQGSLKTMPTEEEMQAEIERLRAENETLKKPARGQFGLKVSEKGALSVYGMGRFPVTFIANNGRNCWRCRTRSENSSRPTTHLLKKKE